MSAFEAGRPRPPDEAHQYAPAVPGGGQSPRGRWRTVERTWPDGPGVADALLAPRGDLVLERPGQDGATFEQAEGPFLTYQRRVCAPVANGATWREQTRYSWMLPWFAWLFTLGVAVGAMGCTAKDREVSFTAPTPSAQYDSRYIAVANGAGIRPTSSYAIAIGKNQQGTRNDAMSRCGTGCDIVAECTVTGLTTQRWPFAAVAMSEFSSVFPVGRTVAVICTGTAVAVRPRVSVTVAVSVYVPGAALVQLT